MEISQSVNSYTFRSLLFFLKLDHNPLIRLNDSLFKPNFEVIIMEKNELPAHIGIIIAGLSFGAVPIFSALLREAQVSSFEQSFIRLLTGCMTGVFIILYFTFKDKHSVRKTLRNEIYRTYIAQGFFLSLSLNFFLASIVLDTPVGEASLLTQIHPIITLFLGFLLLNEVITPKKINSLVVAIIGVILLTQPWQWTSFKGSLYGDILALASGISYGIYIILGRISASIRSNIPSTISIGWVLIWGFIVWIPLFILVSFLPLPQELTTFDILTYFSPENLVYGLGLGLIGNVVPFGLIMICSKQLEVFKTSILLLTEPLGAIILGALILKEAITINYILGGLFLIFAVVITLSISTGRVNNKVHFSEIQNDSKFRFQQKYQECNLVDSDK